MRHYLHPPGNNSIPHQGIFRKFCNGIVPFSRQFGKRVFAVVINIYIMPRAFFRNGISSLIRIYSMLTQKICMLFKQGKHIRRQQEDCVIINFPVCKKSPAKTLFPNKKGKNNEENFFCHFFTLSTVSLTSSIFTTPPVTANFIAIEALR